jgi:hypothetical protein
VLLKSPNVLFISSDVLLKSSNFKFVESFSIILGLIMRKVAGHYDDELEQ